MAIESDALARVNLPTIKSELILASAIVNQYERGDEDTWEPHFHPKVYVKEHPGLKLDEHTMDSDSLKTLGMKLTKFRQNLRDVALEKH